MNPNDDRLRDLLDRWEELCEQGAEPAVEELCRDAPEFIEPLREWVRVLKCGDWLHRRADELADETLGEHFRMTADQKNRCRSLGEYDLLEELGGGGMGRVFRAAHRKMNRTVAVKLLPDSHSRLPDSVKRFQREIQTLAHLTHPNIVSVHDAGVVDGTHFYVMDYVDGEDLARLVREQGPMPVEQALECILQAARGLEYAHAKGIIHRDVKPSNLIIGHDGTVKLLDLGIARFERLPEQSADDLTKTGCVLGTIDYMAPEQAMNTRRADHRADVYGLGCTLYFLLTGQPPFGGDTVMERLVAHREQPAPSLCDVSSTTPKWLDRVFQKMVAKKPEDRYQSMAGVIDDLSRASAPRKRCWRRAAAAAAVVLIAVVAIFLLSSRTSREKDGVRRSLGETNLTAGKRLCFVEDKWDEGLPLLVDGGDAALSRLAAAELVHPTSPDEQIDLGDGWWDYGAKELASTWKGSSRRAAHWYGMPEPTSIPSARREEIEGRLGMLDASGFAAVEVLNRERLVLPTNPHGIAESSHLRLTVVKKANKRVPIAVFSGMELKGVRRLKIGVDSSRNLDALNADAFVAFIIDYRTGSTYTRRVALTLGEKKEKAGERPSWGKGSAVDLQKSIGTKSPYDLDLSNEKWAPPGWDGQVWITLVVRQAAGPRIEVSASLTPLAE
jgi:hypothetical protein